MSREPGVPKILKPEGAGVKRLLFSPEVEPSSACSSSLNPTPGSNDRVSATSGGYSAAIRQKGGDENSPLPSALAILEVQEIRKGGLIQLGAAKGRNGLGTASMDRRGVHQQSPNAESSPTAWYFLAREGEGGF